MPTKHKSIKVSKVINFFLSILTPNSFHFIFIRVRALWCATLSFFHHWSKLVNIRKNIWGYEIIMMFYEGSILTYSRFSKPNSRLEIHCSYEFLDVGHYLSICLTCIKYVLYRGEYKIYSYVPWLSNKNMKLNGLLPTSFFNW